MHPVRCARFVAVKILSGDWLPSGPFFFVWSTFAFASNLQTYAHFFGLGWELLRVQVATARGKGGDRSTVACELCDTVIGLVLKFDSTSPQDVECEALCPPLAGRASCVTTCQRIVEAVQTSSHYPCIASGLCPDHHSLTPHDECVWTGSACHPAGMCKLTASSRRRAWLLFWSKTEKECKPFAGLELWKKYQGAFSEHAHALASALVARPRCGEVGAHPIYCVRATWNSMDLACEYSSIALVAVVGVSRSVHAIETRGGADAKLWLTFWLATLILAVCEHFFAQVLLSRLPVYYQAKLLLVIWLTLFDGANSCYHRARAIRYRIAHSRLFRKRIAPVFAMAYRKYVASYDEKFSLSSSGNFHKDDDVFGLNFRSQIKQAEVSALSELEEQEELSALAEVAANARDRGVKEAYSAAVRGDYGSSVQQSLLTWLEQKEFAFLYARVHSATVLGHAAWFGGEEEGEGGREHRDEEESFSSDSRHAGRSKRRAGALHRSDSAPIKQMYPTKISPFPHGSDGRLYRDIREKKSNALRSLETVQFFDKHNLVSKQASAWSRYYCELHLVSSGIPGHESSPKNATFPRFYAGREKMSRFQRLVSFFVDVYAWCRHHALVEVLLGNLESDSLATARTKSIRTVPFSPTWEEDVELPLVGGSIDESGRFYNPRTPHTHLRIQLWILDVLHPDSLVGETTVPLANVMHGIPTRFDDLPLHDRSAVSSFREEDEEEEEEEESAAEQASSTVSLTLYLSPH